MECSFTLLAFRLRPATEEDLDELWALWTEPRVRLYLWDDIAIEHDQARDTIRDCAALRSKAWVSGRFDCWRALDRLLRNAGFELCAETDGPRYRLRHYTLELEPVGRADGRIAPPNEAR